MIKNPLTGKMIKASGATAKHLLEMNVALPKAAIRAIKNAKKQQVGGLPAESGTPAAQRITIEQLRNALQEMPQSTSVSKETFDKIATALISHGAPVSVHLFVVPDNFNQLLLHASEMSSIDVVDAILNLPKDLQLQVGELAIPPAFDGLIPHIRNFSTLYRSDVVKTMIYYKHLKSDWSRTIEFLSNQDISLTDCMDNAGFKYLVNRIIFNSMTETDFWTNDDALCSALFLGTNNFNTHIANSDNIAFVAQWTHVWIISALSDRNPKMFITNMIRKLKRFRVNTDEYEALRPTDLTNLKDLVAFYKKVNLQDMVIIGI